jgi:transcriptional regulator with XRE-family HTH domain
MKGKELQKFKEEYDFSLDDLALLFGMHKEHVRKLFKREKEYPLLELACKSIIKNKVTQQGIPATGRGVAGFRKRNKLSRKQLGDYLGVSRQAIMYMERKDSKPLGKGVLINLALLDYSE